MGRGDPDDKVAERLRKAEDEEPIGMALADHVVVNDDLEQTIKEMLAIIEAVRTEPGRSALGRSELEVIRRSGVPAGMLDRLGSPEDAWLVPTTR